MRMESRVFCKPRFHQRVLVRRVVIHDDMHVEFRRHAALDSVKKLQKLVVPVPRQALLNDMSRQRIKRGEQRRCAMSTIIVCLCCRQSWAQGKDRCGSIQGLNAAFFVDAQNDSIERRVHVKSHNVAQLGSKIRIVAELERANVMGLQIVGSENPLN